MYGLNACLSHRRGGKPLLHCSLPCSLRQLLCGVGRDSSAGSSGLFYDKVRKQSQISSCSDFCHGMYFCCYYLAIPMHLHSPLWLFNLCLKQIEVVLSIFVCLFVFFFWQHSQHMQVPVHGLNLSLSGNLHHGYSNAGPLTLDPLHWAGGGTGAAAETSQMVNPLHHSRSRNTGPLYLKNKTQNFPLHVWPLQWLSHLSSSSSSS